MKDCQAGDVGRAELAVLRPEMFPSLITASSPGLGFLPVSVILVKISDLGGDFLPPMVSA